MRDKNEVIPAKVEEGEGYVEITFSDDMPRKLIEKQVEECQRGTCQCCTEAFRKKVKTFEILPDSKLKVRVTGEITKEQIVENLMRCAPKLKENN